MASAKTSIGNNIPYARKSAAVVFFAWMDIVMRWQGGGCSTDGGNNGSGNVVALAAMADVGQYDE
jgi:hypothetical protein